MKNGTLWKLTPAISGAIMTLGVAGGILMFMRSARRGMRIMPQIDSWPAQKNFGSFPPDLPDTMFDDVNFV